MCCQTTPAIGIDPMNPITTMRLRFIRRKNPNAERQTPNIERKLFGVGRWTLEIGRSNDSRLEFFHDYGRISGDDRIWFNTFRYHCPGRDNRVLADGYAFQNHSIHSDPDVVADFDWRGFQFWALRTVL